MTTTAKQPGPLNYLACYALWIILAVAFGWALSELHSTWIRVGLALEVNHWVARTVRQWLWPFLGLIWLIVVFWLEHHLRVGVQNGRMLARAARFGAVTVALYLIVLIVRFVT